MAGKGVTYVVQGRGPRGKEWVSFVPGQFWRKPMTCAYLV